MNIDKATCPHKMTLADHAEAWWGEQGNEVPSRDSEEWNTMYEKWIEWAFKDFSDYRKTKSKKEK